MTSAAAAVIVTAAQDDLLEHSLAAVRAQSSQPGAIVVVSCGASRLSDLLDGCRIIELAPSTSAGRAFAAGLSAVAELGIPWAWLIQAGSAPDSEALVALAEAAGSSPSITALSPLRIDERNHLVEAGLTVGTCWRRSTGLAPEEVDQGQYAERSDILGASLDGLLVHVSSTVSAGGLRPILGARHLGLDLCHRLRLAGRRVVLVPAAAHRVPDRRELPRTQELTERWTAWLLAARPGSALVLLLWILVLGAARSYYRIAAKEPREAWAELRAAAAQPARFGTVLALRRRAPKPRVPRAAVDALRLDWQETRQTAKIETESPVGTLDDAGEDMRSAPSNTSGVVDSFSPIDALGAPRRRQLGHPLALATILALAVSILAQFRLIGPGHLVGGALPAAHAGFGELGAAALSSWNPSGLGHAAPADPLLGVLWVWALPFLGHVEISIITLWIIAPALAVLSAYAAAGAVISGPWRRAGLGLIWAALPSLMLALDEGRIGMVISHVTLPLLALGLVRAAGAARPGGRPRSGAGGRPSLTAAAAAGLAVAVIGAGTPVLLPAALIAAFAAALLAPRGSRLGFLAIIPAPLALLGPWLVAVGGAPQLIASQPGALLSSGAVPTWQLLLLQPQQLPEHSWLSGLNPLVIGLAFAPVLGLFILAVLDPRSRTGVLGWSAGAIVLGLLTALLAPAVAVGADPLAIVSGSAAPGVSLLAMGLLLTAVGTLRWVSRRDVHSLAAAALAGLALLGGIGSFGLWAGENLMQHRESSLVSLSQTPPLSALAADRATGPLRQNTLVLRGSGDRLIGEVRGPDGQTLASSSQVVHARAVILPFGLGRAQPIDAAEQAIGSAVAAVTAGSGTDARPLLAAIGVGTILLDADEVPRGHGAPEEESIFGGDDDEASEAVSSALDNSAGLTRLGETAAGLMWSIEAAAGQEPSWAMLVDEDGRRSALQVSPEGTIEIPEGIGSRRVEFAERAASPQRAEIGGVRMQPAEGGWRLAFDVPATAAELRLIETSAAAIALGALRIVLLVFGTLVAIPLPGRRRTPNRSSGAR